MLLRLDDQETGDQVAGEHEEDVDAEEAAGQHNSVARRSDVVGDDRQDGERTDAVKAGCIAESVCLRRGGTRSAT